VRPVDRISEGPSEAKLPNGPEKAGRKAGTRVGGDRRWSNPCRAPKTFRPGPSKHVSACHGRSASATATGRSRVHLRRRRNGASGFDH